MPWIPRGLRDGIVTTRYPRRPDGYGPQFQGSIVVDPESGDPAELRLAAEACPTNAISVVGDLPQLDRGRCILCGRCALVAPRAFRFDPGFELSSVTRGELVAPERGDDDISAARRQLARRVRSLRRSIHIRHVDAGSDGADEWEIAALTNPVYDVQRLGIYFTASPRHADVLLVTGAGAAGMLGPLQHTYEAMPEPKVVIAVGVEAISGGMLQSGYAVRGGVTEIVPVDVFVPGSPATPLGVLHGLLTAVTLLPRLPAHDDGPRSRKSSS
jgi:Ni,Fe-hydrogenase III small subunit/ferredoxin